MKPTERIQELEKENAQLKEQIAGMQKRLQEAETLGTGKGKSKSREQAEEAVKLLEAAGVAGVPLAEFAKLNPKYPSDVAFYIRSILKLDLKTVRKMEGGTRYMLPEHFATYQAAQAKAKAEAKDAGSEAKEEIQAPTQAGATTGTEAAAIAA